MYKGFQLLNREERHMFEDEDDFEEEEVEIFDKSVEQFGLKMPPAQVYRLVTQICLMWFHEKFSSNFHQIYLISVSGHYVCFIFTLCQTVSYTDSISSLISRKNFMSVSADLHNFRFRSFKIYSKCVKLLQGHNLVLGRRCWGCLPQGSASSAWEMEIVSPFLPTKKKSSNCNRYFIKKNSRVLIRRCRGWMPFQGSTRQPEKWI